MTRGAAIGFLLAAALGAAIWWLSPLITRAVEPWDAESPYYFVSLLVAGGLVGLLCPRHVRAAFLGILAGQIAYLLLVLPAGPLLPLGLVFLVAYGLLALLGLALGSRIRQPSGGVRGSPGSGSNSGSE